jgi:hypothetical protein
MGMTVEGLDVVVFVLIFRRQINSYHVRGTIPRDLRTAHAGGGGFLMIGACTQGRRPVSFVRSFFYLHTPSG